MMIMSVIFLHFFNKSMSVNLSLIKNLILDKDTK